ncbi:uncharacterized protein KY384_000451 [Bacidia gigantensis]|uniref:uncharacterized protein n=1 Tax=Bacidia gigantensis TaxID=2732470 RepID=UPI001D044809|nr:uncharacterized protein KY384_000451 [Bacidia gigantensis]KAG8525691.1 hypothetical protein KY384_000451 [Bacidia gigantensis]
MASHFTENQYQKDRLLEFTRPEYIDELYDYTARPRRSILEVLQEFDSVKIPWQWAAAVLPELRGRQFSIAGGGQLKTDNAGHTSFELLVAIVKYKTVIKKIREGVCTRYLANLSPGSHLQVSLQKGGLGLKTINLTKPLVLIGPGTGVAPIRSIIWERLQLAESQSRAEDSEHLALEVSGVGKMLLIFGCRSEAADFFFRDEWASIRNKLPLEVQAAFSRDQVHKVYVQDVVRAQRSEIFRLLHDLEGTVFVCGSSGKMPAAVRVALTDVFQSCSAMNEEQAQGYLAQMERSGRYKQETWG